MAKRLKHVWVVADTPNRSGYYEVTIHNKKPSRSFEKAFYASHNLTSGLCAEGFKRVFGWAPAPGTRHKITLEITSHEER